MSSAAGKLRDRQPDPISGFLLAVLDQQRGSDHRHDPEDPRHHRGDRPSNRSRAIAITVTESTTANSLSSLSRSTDLPYLFR